MKQNKEYKALKKWLQIYLFHVNSRKQLNESSTDGTIKHVVLDADGFPIEVKTGLVKSYCAAMDQQAKETIAVIRKMRRAAQLRKGVQLWRI